MGITKTTEADIPTLVFIVNSAYRGDPVTGEVGWTNEKGLVDGPRMNPEEIDELRNTETATIFKLEEENGDGNGNGTGSVVEKKIIGCVRVELGKGTTEENDGDSNNSSGFSYGYVSLLAVHPSIQTGGIGSRILREAEEWVKGQCGGKAYTQIMVPSVRDALIEFYKRRGYVETGARIPYAVGCACSIEKPNVEFDFVKLTKELN